MYIEDFNYTWRLNSSSVIYQLCGVGEFPQ